LKKIKTDKIELLLVRDTFSENSTLGELFLNGVRICDTLENPWLDNQRNISCIPEGEYDVRLRYPRESGTRDYLHLLIQDVPNRSFCLVHIGNFVHQTRGCVLVGLSSSQDVVNNSKLAMDLLMKEIINLGGTNINLIIKKKRTMKQYIITKLLTSKKVWLGISSIIIPFIANYLGADEEAVTKIWWSLLAMLGGQSFADFGKSNK